MGKKQRDFTSSSVPLSKVFRDFVNSLPEEEGDPGLADSRSEVGLIDLVFARAAEVMGSPENAASWLISPGYAFQGKRPIDLLYSTSGAQAVLDEIGRIQHGIPS